jgi:hypothetical protein
MKTGRIFNSWQRLAYCKSGGDRQAGFSAVPNAYHHLSITFVRGSISSSTPVLHIATGGLYEAR